MIPKDSEAWYVCPECEEKVNTVRERENAVRRGSVWYHGDCVGE